MKGKVLITGASGFIGKNLKARLIESGYQVAEFNSAQGDIAKAELPYTGIEHVFHLAGKSFVPDSWKDPKAFYDVNVSGTLNVLEFCRKTGVGLTFMSSYVYGIPEKLPIGEEHPINPANPYGHSKYMAEQLCVFYQQGFNVKTAIIRPFNIYGAFQNKQFLIAKIIDELRDKTKQEIEVLDLMPRRDYLFMDDLISAIVLLFEQKKTGIYNVGSGYSMSVEDIIKEIMAVAGITKKYISKDIKRPNEIPDVVADISKIESETGWTPSFTFAQGIAEIIKKEQQR